jgi:hypothetical protein
MGDSPRPECTEALGVSLLAEWPSRRRVEFTCAVCHTCRTGVTGQVVCNRKQNPECNKEQRRRATHRAYLRDHKRKVMVAGA